MRQAVSVLVFEAVLQQGRRARYSLSPNSCQGHQSPYLARPGKQEVRVSAMDLYVGIDVSKATLDVAVFPSGDTWTNAHNDSEIEQLTTRLGQLQPKLIVLEATGGLGAWPETPPSAHWWEIGPLRGPFSTPGGTTGPSGSRF